MYSVIRSPSAASAYPIPPEGYVDGTIPQTRHRGHPAHCGPRSDSPWWRWRWGMDGRLAVPPRSEGVASRVRSELSAACCTVSSQTQKRVYHLNAAALIAKARMADGGQAGEPLPLIAGNPNILKLVNKKRRVVGSIDVKDLIGLAKGSQSTATPTPSVISSQDHLSMACNGLSCENLDSYGRGLVPSAGRWSISSSEDCISMSDWGSRSLTHDDWQSLGSSESNISVDHFQDLSSALRLQSEMRDDNNNPQTPIAMPVSSPELPPQDSGNADTVNLSQFLMPKCTPTASRVSTSSLKPKHRSTESLHRMDTMYPKTLTFNIGSQSWYHTRSTDNISIPSKTADRSFGQLYHPKRSPSRSSTSVDGSRPMKSSTNMSVFGGGIESKINRTGSFQKKQQKSSELISNRNREDLCTWISPSIPRRNRSKSESDYDQTTLSTRRKSGESIDGENPEVSPSTARRQKQTDESTFQEYLKLRQRKSAELSQEAASLFEKLKLRRQKPSDETPMLVESSPIGKRRRQPDEFWTRRQRSLDESCSPSSPKSSRRHRPETQQLMNAIMARRHKQGGPHDKPDASPLENESFHHSLHCLVSPMTRRRRDIFLAAQAKQLSLAELHRKTTVPSELCKTMPPLAQSLT